MDAIKLERGHYLIGAYYQMIGRCTKPNYQAYAEYGGRGIQVYEPWLNSRQAFYRWILDNLGPRPSKAYSLDRIDNDGHYVPGNLRWATYVEQGLNRRSSLPYEDRYLRCRGEGQWFVQYRPEQGGPQKKVGPFATKDEARAERDRILVGTE